MFDMGKCFSNTDTSSDKIKEVFFTVLFLKEGVNEHFSNRR
jgi:hypothetical protein